MGPAVRTTLGSVASRCRKHGSSYYFLPSTWWSVAVAGLLPAGGLRFRRRAVAAVWCPLRNGEVRTGRGSV